MEKSYRELMETLYSISYWKEHPEDKKLLPELKLALKKLKSYLQNWKVDRAIEEIEKYEKKSVFTRGIHFSEVREKLSSLVYSILEAGSEVAYEMQPSLKPTERAIVLENTARISVAEGKIKAILESERKWEDKVNSPLGEISESLYRIRTICPWIFFTSAHNSYIIQDRTYRIVGGKETLDQLVKEAYNVVEEVIKRYEIKDSEIKSFLDAGLKAEVEEKTRIIGELSRNLEESNKKREELEQHIKKLEIEKERIKENLKAEKEKGEILRKNMKEKETQNEMLSSQVEKLKKEIEEVKIGALPVDAKREIERRDRKIEELSQLLKSKEEYASSLENKLKEREKEIEDLKKREIKFYPRLREEDLDLLKSEMQELSLAVQQRETIKNIKIKFDKVFSIYSKMYAFRVASGEANKEDNIFLKTLLTYQEQLESQSLTSQPNESLEISTRNLYAFHTTWREHVEAQKRIEEELPHL